MTEVGLCAFVTKTNIRSSDFSDLVLYTFNRESTNYINLRVSMIAQQLSSKYANGKYDTNGKVMRKDMCCIGHIENRNYFDFSELSYEYSMRHITCSGSISAGHASTTGAQASNDIRMESYLGLQHHTTASDALSSGCASDR